MKVTDEHRAHMRDAIRTYVEAQKGTRNPTREAEWLAVGMTARRYRWDIARAANLIPFMCNTLYRYANDTHIDTALRTVVRELGLGDGK
jgi:hypothetical protein